jgi:GntR family transcriptional repressor for pyruvate dehydrogenase complex
MTQIKTARISDQVTEEIKKLIAEKEFKPGDKFYSENYLCKVLGVSRSSIREALRSLEATGWITVQQGKGVFITSTDIHKNEGFVDWLKINKEAVLQHFEVRLMLDPQGGQLCWAECFR